MSAIATILGLVMLLIFFAQGQPWGMAQGDKAPRRGTLRGSPVSTVTCLRATHRQHPLSKPPPLPQAIGRFDHKTSGKRFDIKWCLSEKGKTLPLVIVHQYNHGHLVISTLL